MNNLKKKIFTGIAFLGLTSLLLPVSCQKEYMASKKYNFSNNKEYKIDTNKKYGFDITKTYTAESSIKKKQNFFSSQDIT